jgi:hypothetical protein
VVVDDQAGDLSLRGDLLFGGGLLGQRMQDCMAELGC